MRLFFVLLLLLIVTAPAQARPHILVDLTAGRVLSSNQAFDPWHPASLTKMMTAYTALDQIRAGAVGPDTNVMMTWWASKQSPSKMGYPPGTLIPLRDALAMIAVKSANDVSQAIAESLGRGKAETFAAMMNANAAKLGMTGSYFVNPHGLHHPKQVTTARDMALLARALRTEFPDWMWLWKTPAIRTVPVGQEKARTYRSFNTLLGRFEGADGMKTGYVCPSGWNFAGSATRDDRTVLAIVLGRNTATDRVIDSAKFLERAFEAGPEAAAARPKLDELVPTGTVPTEPPNLRPVVCAVKLKSKPGELQFLPAGVQGPPGPPREWLLPKPRRVETLAVRTAGRIDPAPQLVDLDRIPVPIARPTPPPKPPLDGVVLERSPGPPVPVPRPVFP